MSGPVVHVDDEEEEQEFSVIGNEKALSNGDIYLGSWLANLPDGIGKYLWADGCMYEGEWYKGRKSGKGKFSWPSGATYEGEFKGGFMDGYGTYTGINGSTYRGYWAMNEKHGYGQKSFANGDFYDGSWRHGVQDGQGRYVWKNGNEYVGEWKGGLMCGKGILTWASGNKYDGHWLDGFEHGHGTYTWADGSYFVGTWNKDLKDANGTFYPNSNRSSNNPPSSSGDLQEGFAGNQNGSSLPDNKLFVNSSYMLSCKTIGHNPLVRNTSHRVPPKNVSVDASKRPTAEKPFDRICIWDSGNNEADATCDAVDLAHERSGSSILDNSAMFSMVERGFNGGILVDELDKENVTSKALKIRQNWHLKETKRPGETIFKGHRNYDLMLNLQLGIRYTVGRVTPEPAREICPADFGPKARIWMRFPPEGSKFTPPHQSADFKWKDYCPMVFRHLRELFKIDAADYMLSICGNDALRELSSPGKSGSVFYLSHDDRFMIKTMRKSEVKVLLGMLPNYYNHVCTYEGTLITKFFGLHSVKAAGGQKVRFIVMGNLLCSELHIHRRFDLKGSSQGRSTGKVEIDETTTLKDLDLDFVFRLQPFWCNALLKQIERDCEFLESQRIMDYSLLLGLHFRAPQHPTIISPGPSTELHVPEDAVYATPSCKGVLEGKWNSTRGPVLVARKYDQNWDLAVSRGDPSKAAEVDEVDLFLPGTARKLRIQPGVNMPARAERRPPSRESDSDPEGELFCEVYDVVLYFGIIDILQDYDITKRLEHAYKSLQFSSLSISAVDPKLYAKRFQDFIQRIFIKEP